MMDKKAIQQIEKLHADMQLEIKEIQKLKIDKLSKFQLADNIRFIYRKAMEETLFKEGRRRI